MAVIHSELSKGNYWNQYQKILLGRAKIILSTRQGAFLPIKEQSKIVFFESTSQDFKQYDQHPKYDARIVAQWIRDIANSQIIFASASRQMLKQVQHDVLSLPSARDAKISVKLVDMKAEMQKKDFSIIADSTFDAIQKTIAHNKKVLIISLRQDSEDGVSVNKLHEILTKKLKNCKIAVNYNPNQDFNILVLTAYPLEALKLVQERGKFSLAVFASIEPLLAIPDFRSAQRIFNRLNFWKIMCQELGIGQIILQSYSPENLAVRAFAYGEIEVFEQTELKNRKQLDYPPFKQLIKLSLNRHSEAKPKDLVKNAKTLLIKSLVGAAIIGPFKDKKNQTSILIKFTNKTNLSALHTLSDNWTIDRDPENVL